MLSKRRCAHTGVVNFFSADEPHFSVGSVVKAERGAGYLWRCYAEPFALAGAEDDMQAAEQHIAELCARAASQQGKARYDCAA
jgi:hypothetical protein